VPDLCFNVNVHEARGHKRKRERLQAPLFYSELRPFCSVVPSWAMPLSATPRFQLAPVASSNSSRTAKLHSYILLVGLGFQPFSTVLVSVGFQPLKRFFFLFRW
jgi:hypothetical protein